MLQIALRFPGVFSFAVPFPADEVFKSATKELRVSDMVHFILFLAIDRYRFRGCRHKAVYVVPQIGAEAIHMEDVVDFEGWWEIESVVHITYDFSDFERTQLLGAKLRRLLVYLNLLGL